MGLELKPSKTRITHTLKTIEGNEKSKDDEGDEGDKVHKSRPGFDFLGYEIRQYPVGRRRTGYTGHGKPLGFKTIIKPSKEGIKRHYLAMSAIVDQHRNDHQVRLIQDLNPVITGWSRYYSDACSKQVFSKLDDLLYHKLQSWAYRRHHKKGKHWIANKYWHTEEGKWRFASDGLELHKHSRIPIQRFRKVAGSRSPFDGDWIYWATRRGQHPEISSRIAILLKKQQGRCPYCGLFYKDGDLLEQDHIVPKARGGRDSLSNLQLLHRHCHDRKTAADNTNKLLQASSGGTHEKSQCAEEPCEVNVSRTVLKTSGSGDWLA
ncbi:MAG: HNH endonuclease [Chloroflexi bacterium]|nr:HNH endonuclease [Chloroflexota bacterium]